MPTLLCVDDDSATRELMREALSDSYNVLTTGDPEQALGMTLSHKPDAILLDLMMPKLSGLSSVSRFGH